MPAMQDLMLYVVRVWPHATPFRASVRAVDRDETHVFDQPQALLAYLCTDAPHQIAPPPAPLNTTATRPPREKP